MRSRRGPEIVAIHVWLLSDGEPVEASGVEAFVRRQLSDPHVLQVPSWLRAVAVWLLSWMSTRQLAGVWAQLPGPSPLFHDLEEQAQLLGRSLGQGYRCRPVFLYRSPDVGEAAASVGRGERVVLVPLHPQRCAALYAALSTAQTALNRRGASVSSVPSYPDHVGYVEAVAETLRSALADLSAADLARYEVLFSAALPTGTTAPPDEQQDELERTVAAVVETVGLVRPHRLGFVAPDGRLSRRLPSTAEQLRTIGARRGAAVLVPVTTICDRIETLVSMDRELAQLASESGVQGFIRAEAVAARPTFTRALADLVRVAERDAGWRK